MSTIDKIAPGRRFGKLTVEYDTGKTFGRYTLWHCKCDCGGEIDVNTRDLKYRKTRSCGCVARIGGGIRNLTGRTFGELTVLNITDKRDEYGGVVWHCRCSCGNECDVSSRRLVNGKALSCGECAGHDKPDEKLQNVS
ncbi:MAG: hypothetical protein LUH54_02665 [Firmicutes bacterium]|nr:hypothetical protein [Bacillota bacterium]